MIGSLPWTTRVVVISFFPWLTRASTGCTPSETNLCAKVNTYAGEAGYYEFEGKTGPSPDIEVRIGTTYTFDQRDPTNWYHPLGFAYFPDGAHGETWGGDERDEVEGLGELLYKIDNAPTTCPDAGDTGLDCYEPEFFYPRSEWMDKHYTVELTVTQAMADKSHGGVIFYFCHIHSKMSGKIIIKNADGSAVTKADGSALPNPTPLQLYAPVTISSFDAACGTVDVVAYSDGQAKACSQRFFGGTHDTDFEKCLQAIDCKMNREMRVMGHDDHQDDISTFMQQMIPHHVNAINMAKLLLKHAPSEVAAVEDLEDIMWDIINVQAYQVHQFRNYLGAHSGYLATPYDGAKLTAESLGDHCEGTMDSTVTISGTSATPAATANVQGCAASDTNLCVKVNLFASDTGYYEFAGKIGPSPDIIVQIGKTYTFDQRDPSNWFHPLGFAYFPDGAHGDTWGGDERDEVEGQGELLYKIDNAATTCPDAGGTGLDCYEPEFFHPRADWMGKKYSVELTITQAMADRSHGGVIYYFCHIHSKMSGKIIIQNADGSAVTQANGSPLANPTPMQLYALVTVSSVDRTCGTYGVDQYIGNGAKACSERFLCGTMDTDYEKCLQAVDCKMNRDMHTMTKPDPADKVATFMQQMIPHHENAVNMAKLLLKEVPMNQLSAAMEEDGLVHILNGIVNTQNYQIHQFRNYLGPNATSHYVEHPSSATPSPPSPPTPASDSNVSSANPLSGGWLWLVAAIPLVVAHFVN